MGFFAVNPLVGGYLTSRYHREMQSDDLEDLTVRSDDEPWETVQHPALERHHV